MESRGGPRHAACFRDIRMKKDLLVLAADKDIEYTLKGLLSRPKALDIRPIEVEIMVHPQHDPGCALRGVQFLSSFSNRYEHGLLMFDHEGSGRETTPREELQESLNNDFVRLPWKGRARAIVLSPELEVWVWSDSPQVDEVAGWKGRRPQLRSWLRDQGWLQEGEYKPDQPKEAFHAALRETRQPRSASLYLRMAEKVSLRRCTDRSFQEFKSLMQEWFPAAR